MFFNDCLNSQTFFDMEFIQENPWILIPIITSIISGVCYLAKLIFKFVDKHITMSRLLDMDREDAKFIDNSKLLNGNPPEDKAKLFNLSPFTKKSSDIT